MPTSISILKLNIFGSMTIVGIILFLFAQDITFAPGLAIGGLIAFITEAATPLKKLLNRWKELKEIESAGTRHGDIIVKKVIKLLDGARQVDLLGNILSEFFQGSGGREFKEAINKREDNLLAIRVCIYDPNPENNFLVSRAKDEYEDTGKSIEYQIKNLVDGGGKVIENMRKLKSVKTLELGYIDTTYILDSIIRVDNKIIVIDYLHRSGTGTPFYILREGEIYNVYKNEFEFLWSKAKKFNLKK